MMARSYLKYCTLNAKHPQPPPTCLLAVSDTRRAADWIRTLLAVVSAPAAALLTVWLEVSENTEIKWKNERSEEEDLKKGKGI